MGIRLGEELVSRGAITPRQLEEGLQAQLIHGGHLGTCLLELGYIDERRLGETLAEILGVRYAEPELFRHLPDTLLKEIPRELAEKHRAVPLRLVDKRTLHVAMVTPKDLTAIDELQFACGHQIQAWVAPEVCIAAALERDYGIKRSRRFLLLSADPTVLPLSSDPVDSIAPAAAPDAPGVAADRPVWDELDFEASRNEKPLRRLADAIDEVGEEMCATLDASQLGSTVVDCLTCGLERTILFRVHKQVASVWDSRGFNSLVGTCEELAIPVLEEPLFKLLGENGAYLGPPSGIAAESGFYRKLRVELPEAVLLVPVYVEDQLVAILYGDSGSEGRIEGTLTDYQRVARKIGPALEIQALARKVRFI